MKHLIDIVLTLFDEGAAPAGEGAGAEAGGSEPKAGAVPPGSGRRGKTGEKVLYGKQSGTAEPDGIEVDPAAGDQGKKSGVTTTSDTLEAKRAEFEKMIRGEYGDVFTERVQGIIDRRFAETRTLQEQLTQVSPILDILADRYGVQDGDPRKLAEAIEKDTKYWEEAAEQAGMDVEQYKEYKRIERENERLRHFQRHQREHQAAQQQVSQWYQQAEEAKGMYPDFDFEAEAKNPDFLGLLEAGIPVQKAYEVIHVDDLVTGAARASAKAAEQQVVSRIKTKQSRPAENGTSAQSGVLVKDNVSSLTRKDRAEIARRVARGEVIQF